MLNVAAAAAQEFIKNNSGSSSAFGYSHSFIVVADV